MVFYGVTTGAVVPRSPEVQRVGRSVDSVGCGSCLEWDGGAGEIPMFSDSMETVSLNPIYILYVYYMYIYIYTYTYIYMFIIFISFFHGMNWIFIIAFHAMDGRFVLGMLEIGDDQ